LLVAFCLSHVLFWFVWCGDCCVRLYSGAAIHCVFVIACVLISPAIFLPFSFHRLLFHTSYHWVLQWL
jgi:hypothetical protein